MGYTEFWRMLATQSCVEDIAITSGVGERGIERYDNTSIKMMDAFEGLEVPDT